MMPWALLQLTLITFFPFVSRRLHSQKRLPPWLSPVVLCYALGIILSNFRFFPLDNKLSTAITEITIILAIPLLLYGTRLNEWFGHARSTLISFCLCVAAGLASTTVAAFVYASRLDSTWRLSGMLVGIYTGGTPNMQAIGLALGASQESIILLNAADVLIGGIYLLFLTSFAPKVYRLFLAPFKGEGPEESNLDVLAEDNARINYRDSLKAIVLTLAIIGITLGICRLAFGNLENIAFIMLLLTTLSIGASFAGRVRRWENTFETGEYFLLMFCVALGMLADFSEILAQGPDVITFSIFAFLGTVLLHLLGAALFRIDRDTVLFTSVAALYGPAFIGQIASITGNRQLIFSGIAVGLLGYAIGNYLGIGLAYGLRALLGAG
ncbi:MAG: DUF819 family protein [Lewinellaceae bacterium]|nr:DUF819 family protein [Phaeodactylibacter sp.]MCB0613115.1 DUF819 family protein [Phaeodactylibacter sp.]MCB9351740.1 DUF819 family protein [Lewinellaceae bacterium]